MEMVKIQMQLASTTRAAIPSTISVVRSLGLRGLYRGSLATLMRDVPFSMCLFETFATLKHHLGNVFVSGLIAGAIAALVVTPMDVVKTRYQATRGQEHGIGEVYRRIWRIEGPQAFFKGAPQRCLIVAPLFGISLLAYELQQRLLLQ